MSLKPVDLTIVLKFIDAISDMRAMANAITVTSDNDLRIRGMAFANSLAKKVKPICSAALEGKAEWADLKRLLLEELKITVAILEGSK